jgi:hypothetical protein
LRTKKTTSWKKTRNKVDVVSDLREKAQVRRRKTNMASKPRSPTTRSCEMDGNNFVFRWPCLRSSIVWTTESIEMNPSRCPAVRLCLTRPKMQWRPHGQNAWDSKNVR